MITYYRFVHTIIDVNDDLSRITNEFSSLEKDNHKIISSHAFGMDVTQYSELINSLKLVPFLSSKIIFTEVAFYSKEGICGLFSLDTKSYELWSQQMSKVFGGRLHMQNIPYIPLFKNIKPQDIIKVGYVEKYINHHLGRQVCVFSEKLAIESFIHGVWREEITFESNINPN